MDVNEGVKTHPLLEVASAPLGEQGEIMKQ